MSALEQIQSTAEDAILELESEIIELEEKIESYKLRIQGARVQIQALKKFLSPEESGPALNNSAINDIVLQTLAELNQQPIYYKDLTNIIIEKGYEIPGKHSEKTINNCLVKLARAGKAKNTGKGYYEAIKEERQEF